MKDDLVGLYLLREGMSGREDTENVYEVHLIDGQLMAGFAEGDNVRVKGVMRYKATEDYFGDVPEGLVRPYVMEVKSIKAETATAPY